MTWAPRTFNTPDETRLNSSEEHSNSPCRDRLEISPIVREPSTSARIFLSSAPRSGRAATAAGPRTASRTTESSGNRVRIFAHSSRRWIPSMMILVLDIDRVIFSLASDSPSRNSKNPVRQWNSE